MPPMRGRIPVETKRTTQASEGRAVIGVDMSDPNRWSGDRKTQFAQGVDYEINGYGGTNLLDVERKKEWRQALKEFENTPAWETWRIDAAARKVQVFRDENQALKDDFLAHRKRASAAAQALGRIDVEEAAKAHVKALKKANGIPGDTAVKKLPDGQRALAESIIFDAKNAARVRAAAENNRRGGEVLRGELARTDLTPRTRSEVQKLHDSLPSMATTEGADKADAKVAEKVAVWNAVRAAAGDGDPGAKNYDFEVRSGGGISEEQATELTILGRRDGNALAERAAARLRGESAKPAKVPAPASGPSGLAKIAADMHALHEEVFAGEVGHKKGDKVLSTFALPPGAKPREYTVTRDAGPGETLHVSRVDQNGRTIETRIQPHDVVKPEAAKAPAAPVRTRINPAAKRGALAAAPGKGDAIAPLDRARIQAATEDYAAANHGGALNLSRDDTARYVTEGHLQALEKKYGTSTVQDAVRAHIDANPRVLDGPKDGGRAKEAARKAASADVAEQARLAMKDGRYADALAAVDRGETRNPDFTINGVGWDAMRARINSRQRGSGAAPPVVSAATAEKRTANLAKARTAATEKRVSDLQESKDPKDNGAKIRAIADGRMDHADLYRKIMAGPSGQRSDLKVGRIRHTPDNPFGEFKVTDRNGQTAGWVTSTVRDGEQVYAVHSENGSGETRLEGWADTIAHAADVLTNGETAASTGGSLDARRISGRMFHRYEGRNKTVAELDREALDREIRQHRDALAKPDLTPGIRARHEASLAKLETERRGQLDTRRDSSHTGGVSNAPTTEANVNRIQNGSTITVPAGADLTYKQPYQLADVEVLGEPDRNGNVMVRGTKLRADGTAGKGASTVTTHIKADRVAPTSATEANVTKKPGGDTRPRSELSHGRDSLLRTAAVIHERLGPQPGYTVDDPDKTEVNAAIKWSRDANAIAKELGTKNPYESGHITGELIRGNYLAEATQDGERVNGSYITGEGLRHVADTAPTPKGGGRTGATAKIEIAARHETSKLGRDVTYQEALKLMAVAGGDDDARQLGFAAAPDQPVKAGDVVMVDTFSRYRRGIVTEVGVKNVKVAYTTPTGGRGVMHATRPNEKILRKVGAEQAAGPQVHSAAPKATPEEFVAKLRTVTPDEADRLAADMNAPELRKVAAHLGMLAPTRTPLDEIRKGIHNTAERHTADRLGVSRAGVDLIAASRGTDSSPFGLLNGAERVTAEDWAKFTAEQRLRTFDGLRRLEGRPQRAARATAAVAAVARLASLGKA